MAEALKHVPRDKVTVLTKTWARDPATARADLDRFRKELGTDYLDICLMHCLTEADWTERYQGVMDVFSEAKEKGIIRAHGCSCHSIDALRAAAKSPWVEVDLVRMNPVGAFMDADPQTVVGVVKEMTGGATFNEVFFSDARVPHDNVIGDVDRGWSATVTTLSHERKSLGAGGLGGMAGGGAMLGISIGGGGGPATPDLTARGGRLRRSCRRHARRAAP